MRVCGYCGKRGDAMKIRLTTLALSIFFKPAVWVALFAAVSRIAELSGFGRAVIDPVAGSIAEITPLTYDYAVVLITALIAYSLLRILTSICSVIAVSTR
jgi:hypothetical protein